MTGKNRIQYDCGFTIIELVAAMSMLAAVVCCFSVVLRGFRDMETNFEAENRSLVVLCNVIERLESEPVWDKDKVSWLLNEEFRNSDLSKSGSFMAECTMERAEITACIRNRNGKSLATVGLKR